MKTAAFKDQMKYVHSRIDRWNRAVPRHELADGYAGKHMITTIRCHLIIHYL
jgi:hypothetical protein